MTTGPLLGGEDADGAKNTDPLPEAPMPIFANMAIQGGRGWTKKNQPVHESMTIAALIASKFPISEGTTYKNAPKEIKEFLRGCVWNDDPGCLLFEQDAHDNYKLSDGIQWGAEYKSAEGGLVGGFIGFITRTPQQTITGRSHFGDLQFLHAMAAQEKEEPQETKSKIMMWLEIMYKLSVGDQGGRRLELIDRRRCRCRGGILGHRNCAVAWRQRVVCSGLNAFDHVPHKHGGPAMRVHKATET
jgi:hypothetical protein